MSIVGTSSPTSSSKIAAYVTPMRDETSVYLNGDLQFTLNAGEVGSIPDIKAGDKITSSHPIAVAVIESSYWGGCRRPVSMYAYTLLPKETYDTKYYLPIIRGFPMQLVQNSKLWFIWTNMGSGYPR